MKHRTFLLLNFFILIIIPIVVVILFSEEIHALFWLLMASGLQLVIILIFLITEGRYYQNLDKLKEHERDLHRQRRLYQGLVRVLSKRAFHKHFISEQELGDIISQIDRKQGLENLIDRLIKTREGI